MPSLKRDFEQFSPEIYLKTQTNVLELKSKLPEDIVGAIIDEVLNRVQVIRSSNSYDIDNPPQHVVDSLCYALIAPEPGEGAALIEALRQDGASLDAIYLAYLAEAARTLGDWWNEDHVTFVEVSIGSSRIYSIMRSLSYLFVPNKPVLKKSAVFACVPDETHIVGVRMAADLLGQEGWDIDLHVGLSHAEVVQEIASSDCQIVGLSAGGSHSAPGLARLIIALRVSKPGARIFVSGQIVRDAPELVALMDLDGVVDDIDSALSLMDRFWSETSATSDHSFSENA